MAKLSGNQVAALGTHIHAYAVKHAEHVAYLASQGFGEFDKPTYERLTDEAAEAWAHVMAILSDMECAG